jgi:hypothetical protein
MIEEFIDMLNNGIRYGMAASLFAGLVSWAISAVWRLFIRMIGVGRG